MKKKMLAFLMAVLIVVGIFPVTAMADDPVYFEIGGNKYGTLQAAVNAATDGDTIIMLDNVANGIGVKIETNKFNEKGLTIDFNGKTYTAVSGPVGSENTENQVFQLLKGSKITMKNGTIAVGGSTNDFRMVIQNYADLTLDGMTLNGTNLDGNPYTLSNNCGTTLIKDSTIIAANGGCALDSYYWPKGGYNIAPKVTIENSTIRGTIEVAADSDHDVQNDQLTVKSGSFTDLANAVKYAESGATIKLADDVTITSQLNINKAITLDGNGKKIDGNAIHNNGAILVDKVAATIKNLTVSGPNTTASGWDNGEFGIKLYKANGATLDGVTVTGANAGIQVNGGSVTMENNITVSGNEFGGIELCHGGELNLSAAKLVNVGETDANPVLWNDDTKGTITFSESQPLSKKIIANEDKDHYYLSGTAQASLNGQNYLNLADAIAEAQIGDTVDLLKNVTVKGTGVTDGSAGGTTLRIDKNGVTLNGHGFTLTEGGSFDANGKCSMIGIYQASGVTVKNLTIVGNNHLGHGINIWQCTGNINVENVTVNNATRYAVVVNESNATIDGLTAVRCGWGGVNVDKGTAPSATIKNCTIIDVVEGKESDCVKVEKGSATIESGTYAGVNAVGGGTLSITGGTFSSNPNVNYIAENYFAKKLSDNEWKVEPKAKVEKPDDIIGEETEVKIGNKEVTVKVTDTDKPTAGQAVEAINEALANTAVTTENAKDFKEKINTEIVGGIIVDSEVRVELQSVEVEKADDGATITEMVFDVKPVAVFGTGNEQVIPNSAIKAPITFRLPVSSNIGTTRWAAVYHEGKFMSNYEIKGDETNKYIEVSSKEFSIFGYVLVDPDEAIAQVGDVPYRTLGEAVKEASGKTITVLKNTDEVVTVERAMSFELEVANGVNFTGAIKPGDDYVRHIYGDKYYFELYEAGDTIVIGGNRNKDTKTETKEENPETGAPVMNMGVLAVLAVAYVATRKH